MDSEILNQYGRERISDRQVDELIGLAKGISADGAIHQSEVEFLQTWLAANLAVSGQPLIRTLYDRISEILSDGIVDEDEKSELLATLQSFVAPKSELGEALKATTLPLCNPFPTISITGASFCFTGTFAYGNRRACETAVAAKGGLAGSLTRETRYLVIGTYVTDSWKHSSFGNKILKAVEMREKRVPISIVGEDHWVKSI
ncbi:MAG: NAD-dependent DNA ligase [Comamonadaceae bacterium]|nr:MAG: NAD-dependent DNA ligase [Comamonadaceae bacterium]